VRKVLIDRLLKQIKDARADPDLRKDQTLLERQIRGLTTVQFLVSSAAESGAAAGAPADATTAAAKALVPMFESARTDKTVGAPATGSGTTNLVSKGSIPSVLGFAVENGALTRTVSGTSITFQGSPAGILEALTNKGFIQGYLNEDGVPLLQALRRVGFAATFDTSRGAASTAADASVQPVFTGSSQQLASWSLRASLVNQRDPRHPAHRAEWSHLAATALEEVSQNAQKLAAKVNAQLGTRADLRTWENNFFNSVVQAGDDEAALRSAIDKALTEVEKEDDFLTGPLQDALTASIKKLLPARNEVLKKIARGPIATYEFTNNRQANAADLLNHRLIFETDLLGNGKGDFTLNASLTHFSTTNGLPVNSKSIRDYQFGAQLDVPVASNGAMENWLLTGAWRYMRLLESQKIPGTDLTAPTGVVNLIQGKLTVPVKDGVKIPLSISWSNRTELVKNHRDIRVNLGVLLDGGVLLSKLKP